MTKHSRGASAPEFCSTKNESSGPDPVGWRRRWDRLHLDRARLTKKSGRRNAGRRVCPTSAPATCILPRVRGRTEEGRGARPAGRARLSAFHRGACGSEPTPPLSSSTRFLGRGPHQALPEAGLSQSSELLADRSWCRPGVFPEPPGDGSDEPPSAGTALAPAAGVTRRPSYKLSEIRDVRIRNRDKCQAIVAISATAGSCRKAGAPQHRACYRFSRGEKRGVNDRRQGNRHFARRHRQDRDGEDRAIF